MEFSGKLRKTYFSVFSEDDFAKRVKRTVSRPLSCCHAWMCGPINGLCSSIVLGGASGSFDANALRLRNGLLLSVQHR
jgi:hypothetical protein